jgi:hypothetical protein
MMMRWITTCALLAFSASTWAISPYIQGDSISGANAQAIATAVETKLKNGGFKVIGKYFPKTLAGYGVVVATDENMLDTVGSVGGNAILGAAIRVGVKADGTVTYTNPDYWYRAYFRKGFAQKEPAVKALQAKLQDALGAGKGVGGDESAGTLTNYRYMIGMERIDSPKAKLAEHGSFADAVKLVRDNLAKGGKTTKVYEVVMPDRKLAVFGVAMSDGPNNDGDWLKKIEQQNLVAGLPYEVIVVGDTVSSPYARFRIALAFPDVGMGQFMRISSLPEAVKRMMESVAGTVKKEEVSAWQ